MTRSPTIQTTPPPTPPSPTASFYDLSDDEEGEYNTIMHSKSGKGVKLLFSKSKVSRTSRQHSIDHMLTILRYTYILHLHRRTTYRASLHSYSRNHQPPIRTNGQPRLRHPKASKPRPSYSLGCQNRLWVMPTMLTPESISQTGPPLRNKHRLSLSPLPPPFIAVRLAHMPLPSLSARSTHCWSDRQVLDGGLEV